MQLIYADFFELVESLRGTKQSREIKQVKRVKTSVIASFLAKTYGMKIIFSNKPIAYSLALIEAKILLCLVFSTRHRRVVADSRNPCLPDKAYSFAPKKNIFICSIDAKYKSLRSVKRKR